MAKTETKKVAKTKKTPALPTKKTMNFVHHESSFNPKKVLTPRPGEVNGKNYHFLTREEFESRVSRGEMLEYTEYCGNYYGTPKKELYERTVEGINVILEIEVEGAMNVRRLCPEAVLIYVLPPDAQTLEARLRGRGTNTEEDIKNRLATAREEIRSLPDYDYLVYNENDGAEAAAEEIVNIILAEQHKVSRNLENAIHFFEK